MHTEASKDKVFFGFWIYLMTDLLMFSVLFATYTVLRNGTNGGIEISEIFNPSFVLVETLILLVSSFVCGLALVFLNERNKVRTLLFLGCTALLGVVFIFMELYEFSTLISEGNSFTKSAFLSSFFTLLSFHGLHLLAGIVWVVTLMVSVYMRGFKDVNVRKIKLWGIFWHFLDIVWIFIFSFVYLMGVIS
jgi:cytochrome o ubiquinol oxidase subunit 3